MNVWEEMGQGTLTSQTSWSSRKASEGCPQAGAASGFPAVFNAFFASIFNTGEDQRGSQSPELGDHDCENDHLLVDPEIVQDPLLQLDPYKSVGPDRIHPRSLSEILMSSQNLSQCFFSLGNPERSELTGSW